MDLNKELEKIKDLMEELRNIKNLDPKFNTVANQFNVHFDDFITYYYIGISFPKDFNYDKAIESICILQDEFEMITFNYYKNLIEDALFNSNFVKVNNILKYLNDQGYHEILSNLKYLEP